MSKQMLVPNERLGREGVCWRSVAQATMTAGLKGFVWESGEIWLQKGGFEVAAIEEGSVLEERA